MKYVKLQDDDELETSNAASQKELKSFSDNIYLNLIINVHIY